LEVSQRFLALTLALISESPIGVPSRIVRLKPDCLVAVGDDAVKIALGKPCSTTNGESMCSFWIEADCFVAVRDSVIRIIFFSISKATVEKRGGIFRI
jgi:hypothetical protein